MLLNCSYPTSGPIRYINRYIPSSDYIIGFLNYYIHNIYNILVPRTMFISCVGMIMHCCKVEIKWQGCLEMIILFYIGSFIMYVSELDVKWITNNLTYNHAYYFYHIRINYMLSSRAGRKVPDHPKDIFF